MVKILFSLSLLLLFTFRLCLILRSMCSEVIQPARMVWFGSATTWDSKNRALVPVGHKVLWGLLLPAHSLSLSIALNVRFTLSWCVHSLLLFTSKMLRNAQNVSCAHNLLPLPPGDNPALNSLFVNLWQILKGTPASWCRRLQHLPGKSSLFSLLVSHSC